MIISHAKSRPRRRQDESNVGERRGAGLACAANPDSPFLFSANMVDGWMASMVHHAILTTIIPTALLGKCLSNSCPCQGWRMKSMCCPTALLGNDWPQSPCVGAYKQPRTGSRDSGPAATRVAAPTAAAAGELFARFPLTCSRQITGSRFAVTERALVWA